MQSAKALDEGRELQQEKPLRTIDKRAAVGMAGLAALGAGLYWYLSTHFPEFATDWHITYYPATMHLLRGENPYLVTTLHNPVWGLFPIIPLALLGTKVGIPLLFALDYACYAYAAIRLKAKPVALVAFLLSPMVMLNLAIDNIDALEVLGLLLPAPVGLFFAVLKPQIGVAVAAYWAYEAWKTGGMRKLVLTFLPVSVALAITFALYGNWTANRSDQIMVMPWNASLFPWSVPVGLLLLYLSLKRGKISNAISASPFLSPYVGVHSWGVALAGLLEYPWVTVAVSAGLWIASGIIWLRYFR